MKYSIRTILLERIEYAIGFWLGVALFLLSNAYFGWNTTAQSGAERVCDFIWVSLVLTCGIQQIARNIVEEAFSDVKFDLTREE